MQLEIKRDPASRGKGGMKIAVTISDACDLVNAGGELEKRTHVIKIPDRNIPYELKHYLALREKWRKEDTSHFTAMSISLVAD